MTAQPVPPRRLLMVVNELESFFNHRLPIARGARAAGWDVHVAMADAAQARARDVDGLAFHTVPLTRSFAAPHREAAAMRALGRVIGETRPDTVHAFTLKPVLLAGLVTRLRRGPPMVGSITGLGSFFAGTGAADRAVQAAASAVGRLALGTGRHRVIVQNRDDRALMAAQFGVPPGRLALIPGSGVDLVRFAPAPEPEGPLRVVLAARMIADKGVRDFVEAARLLKAAGGGTEFILAGGLDPENRSAIAQAEIDAWVAEGLVTWIGHSNDMASLYKSCHIACLPSRYREGVPKSLIEAAACGRPAVTTDMPGCRDIVIDGKTGFVVPVGDARALADALGRLTADVELRARMGAAGRRHAEDGYGEDAVVRCVLGIYDSLTASAR